MCGRIISGIISAPPRACPSSPEFWHCDKALIKKFSLPALGSLPLSQIWTLNCVCVVMWTVYEGVETVVMVLVLSLFILPDSQPFHRLQHKNTGGDYVCSSAPPHSTGRQLSLANPTGDKATDVHQAVSLARGLFVGCVWLGGRASITIPPYSQCDNVRGTRCPAQFACPRPTTTPQKGLGAEQHPWTPSNGWVGEGVISIESGTRQDQRSPASAGPRHSLTQLPILTLLSPRTIQDIGY